MSHKFKYVPDEDLPVHKEQALKLLCKVFASHENGIPEWVKNASDEYIRTGRTFTESRAIIVLFKNGRGDQKARIACLDFSGMTSQVINQHFRVWADPDAAKRGGNTTGIQGGHGNGGKCYMSHMFEDHSYIETVKNGLGNLYGVIGGSIRFGYIPDPKRGCDYPVKDVKKALNEALRSLGADHNSLPADAQRSMEGSQGFTLVCGVGPKHFGNRLPVAQLVNYIQQHPQMIQSLEMCSIYVVDNGKLAYNGQPLSLPDIRPHEGGETPRVIAIPERLKDPVTGQRITTCQDQQGILVLKTSAKSMHWKLKVRHNITYRTSTDYIGYKEVPQFDVSSPYRQYIYGECSLDALAECKSNDRYHLTNSPLTRAVERFVAREIEKFAREFEDREKKKYGREEKSAVSRMNEFLNKWKNRFLNEFMKGLTGGGEGPGVPPPEPLPTGIPSKLELEMAYSLAGVGVTFRPRLQFFDKDGMKIHSVPYRWVSEDTNVAMVDEGLNVINTYSIGSTMIYAETLDGKLRSTAKPLEVVNIHEIRITPDETEVAAGGRTKLVAICSLDDDVVSDDVCLTWTEDNVSVARVSSTGIVFGASIGETQVIAGDDRCQADVPATIKVVERKEGGKGKEKGHGYPQILVSGEFDPDPETQEYRYFSKEEPPVVQYPEDVDRNIFWINSAAPLAQLFLDVSQYGYESREWRLYHVERLIEVVSQIALRVDEDIAKNLSPEEWMQSYGTKAAQIQSEIVETLARFIEDGTQAED